MEATFEGISRRISDKNYHDVAATIYEAYKDKFGKAAESWVNRIENRLKSIHQQKLSDGLFSMTQKEVGGETYAETIDWLEKELGIERKDRSIGWLLGIND